MITPDDSDFINFCAIWGLGAIFLLMLYMCHDRLWSDLCTMGSDFIEHWSDIVICMLMVVGWTLVMIAVLRLTR